MGKSHQIARINFRKCDGVFAVPVEMVAYYVLGGSHGDSDVEWVFRKLDRWKNDSSFMSNTETTYGSDVEDTTTSRLTFEPKCSEVNEDKSNWFMHAPLQFYSDSELSNGVSVTISNMQVFNGVSSKKLKDHEIESIMRKLRKGSTSSNWEEGESSKASIRSTSMASSKA